MREFVRITACPGVLQFPLSSFDNTFFHHFSSVARSNKRLRRFINSQTRNHMVTMTTTATAAAAMFEHVPPSRPRANSFTLSSSDCLSALVGVLCGLLVFARDASQFFGGAVVLSFALLALCNEDPVHGEMSRTKFSSPSRFTVIAHTVLSWALLWSTLASLEAAATTRWSIPFAGVYALYFFLRGAQEQQHAKSLVCASLVGLVVCVFTSRVFAMYYGPRETIALAVFWHAVWWTLNWASNPRGRGTTPKAILLDAPLFGVRDVFRQTSVFPRRHSNTSKQQ